MKGTRDGAYRAARARVRAPYRIPPDLINATLIPPRSTPPSQFFARKFALSRAVSTPFRVQRERANAGTFRGDPITGGREGGYARARARGAYFDPERKARGHICIFATPPAIPRHARNEPTRARITRVRFLSVSPAPAASLCSRGEAG